jgi:predicted kinase
MSVIADATFTNMEQQGRAEHIADGLRTGGVFCIWLTVPVEVRRERLLGRTRDSGACACVCVCV